MGFLLGQAFVEHVGWTLKVDRQFQSKVAKGMIENQMVHVILPLTYMNLSGNAVKRYVDYYKIPLDHILVMVDDIALPFGHIRIKTQGSSGGHNGLKSIEACLGSSHYARMRLGIGHPGGQSLADYVLEPFSHLEQQELPTFIQHGVKILKRLLTETFSHVMTSINSVSAQPKGNRDVEHKTIDLTQPPVIG